MAFKNGENQNQRRSENVSRQNRARSDVFDTNRQLSDFEFPPISVNSTPHLIHTQTLTSTTASRHPTTSMTASTTTGYKFSTSLPATNPTPTTRGTKIPGVSGSTRNEDRIEDIHAKLDHLIKKSDEAEQMKVTISSNTARLDRMEAKLGKPEDIAVPLSLAIRNLPLPGHGEDDFQIVKALLFEIRAKDVNPDSDIVKVLRQGATGDNVGTVFVELISDDVRASVMKTKKILEHHQNPCLRRIIIKNMKSRQELKMDIAMNEMLKKLPGGENLYMANNGHIREKTAHQMAFQLSLHNRVPRVPMPRVQAPPQPPQSLYAANNLGTTRYQVQDPALAHTNQAPAPAFRYTFAEHPVPGANIAKFHDPAGISYSSTTYGAGFRYSLPPPPVPVPPIPYPAPTPWSSAPLLPTSSGLLSRSAPAYTDLSVNYCEATPISQSDQSTSITSVSGDHHPGQADLMVVSQANPQQLPVVRDQQLQEQHQEHQLTEQPQQQQVLVTSEPDSDL